MKNLHDNKNLYLINLGLRKELKQLNKINDELANELLNIQETKKYKFWQQFNKIKKIVKLKRSD